MFETFVQDVRYALRLFQRNRLFALVASTTLAIGIAATTTVFSLVNTMLLSSPEFVKDPDNVVGVYFDRNSSAEIDYQGVSYPRYDVLAQQQDVFSGIAFYYRTSPLVTIDE